MSKQFYLNRLHLAEVAKAESQQLLESGDRTFWRRYLADLEEQIAYWQNQLQLSENQERADHE